MQGWFRSVQTGGFRVLGYLFQTFILTCGLHHLVMLRFMQTHPVDIWQLLADGATAIAAIVTSIVIVRYRSNIRLAFRTMFGHIEEWAPPSPLPTSLIPDPLPGEPGE